MIFPKQAYSIKFFTERYGISHIRAVFPSCRLKR